MKSSFSKWFFLICLASLGACAKKGFLANSKGADQAFEECNKYSESKSYPEAIQCFEVLKSRYGGSQAAIDADLEIAENHFRMKEYLIAAEAYLAFTKRYPMHEKVGYAYYKAGLSYLRENPKAVDRDQEYLDTAIQYFELAMNHTSGDLHDASEAKWREARLRIARRHFYVGNFYHRTGEYLSAIPRFQEIVTNYTGLGLDEESLFLMGDSFLHLNEKEKALEILGVFEKHFPQSSYRKKLASKLGVD